MKKVKKITMLVAGATVMLNTAILAVTGTVNAPSGLVLREEPAKTGEPITTVEDNTKVEIVEKNGEWYKVNYNGQEGYLFAEYVKEDEQSTPPANPEENNNVNPAENTPTNPPENTPVSAVGTEVQLKNEVKIYMMPLMSSTPIGNFALGTTVKVEKEVTNWSYVTNGTQSGWIRTYLINGEQVAQTQTPEEPNNTTEPTTQEPDANNQGQPTQENPKPPVDNTVETPSVATKGTINVDFANVRKSATQESEVVTTLAYGTTFTISAETEEWYKITYTGLDGTVYDGYIARRLVIVE